MSAWIPAVVAAITILLPKVLEWLEGGSLRRSFLEFKQEQRRFNINLFLFNERCHPDKITDLDWQNMYLLCTEYIKEHKRFPEIDGLCADAAKEIIEKARQHIL